MELQIKTEMATDREVRTPLWHHFMAADQEVQTPLCHHFDTTVHHGHDHGLHRCAMHASIGFGGWWSWSVVGGQVANGTLIAFARHATSDIHKYYTPPSFNMNLWTHRFLEAFCPMLQSVMI
jgi:hypothetical protein